MEITSLNLVPFVSFVVLIVDFLMSHVLNRVGGIQKLFSRCQYYIRSQIESFDVLKSDEVVKEQQESDFSNKTLCSSEETCDEFVKRGDIETVMEKLGLFCSPEDDKLEENFTNSDYFLNMFEEREPSFEEVKGAFDVFDENKDGFIDAKELHRVLSILGLKEGLEVENCRMMIGVFDKNGDGKIDFNEFVQVMERGFC